MNSRSPDRPEGGRAGGAPGGFAGLETSAQESNAPAESLHPLFDQHLHPVWKYRLHGGDECRVLAPSGATRDEILADLERLWPERPVQYLAPVVGGA